MEASKGSVRLTGRTTAAVHPTGLWSSFPFKMHDELFVGCTAESSLVLDVVGGVMDVGSDAEYRYLCEFVVV